MIWSLAECGSAAWEVLFFLDSRFTKDTVDVLGHLTIPRNESTRFPWHGLNVRQICRRIFAFVIAIPYKSFECSSSP